MLGAHSKLTSKLILALLTTATPASAQLIGPISNPIPTPITKSGLRVGIEDWAQFPNTRNTIGGKPDRINTDTRINFMRQAPDGRYFVNDLRGQFYVLDQNQQPQMYVDLDEEGASLFPRMNFDTGLAAGFTAFEFHPEFATNGIFYTAHSERVDGGSPAATFVAPDATETGASVKFHEVITEWTATNPSASAFAGTRREVARFGMTANNFFHPLGDMSFNPHALPSDDDYGLLYMSGGDWGFINGASPDQVGVDGKPAQLQRLDTLAGTAIRIDPRSPTVTGGPAGHGDYTIPTGNPFFEDANSDSVDDDPSTFGEIWAYGFRNGHRMTWTDDGRLLVSQVGQAHLETTFFLEPGANYGWPRREGSFVNGANAFYSQPGDLDHGANGVSDNVFHLPAAIADGSFDDGLEYPVLQFDHGEGFANSGGFVYTGTEIPALTGKFVFGEIVNGRVFYSDYDAMLAAVDGIPTTTADIHELQLVYQGVPVDLATLVPGRVDLRLATDDAGDLYLMTKGDGAIRRLFSVGPPGDFNGDGLVTLEDYVRLTENMHKNHSGMTAGQIAALGDLNGDLLVNYADFVQFQQLYPGPLSPLPAQPAPEPSSAALVALGLIALAARKRSSDR